jgi:hypothetical protein
MRANSDLDSVEVPPSATPMTSPIATASTRLSSTAHAKKITRHQMTRFAARTSFGP